MSSTLKYDTKAREVMNNSSKSRNNLNGSKERNKNGTNQVNAVESRVISDNRPNSANNVQPRRLSSTAYRQNTPNTTFEVYDSHTLIVKRNSSNPSNDKPKDSNKTRSKTPQQSGAAPTTSSKTRTQQLFQSQQPTIIVKPRYNHTNVSNTNIIDGAPKINRLAANSQNDVGRSMSATIIRSANHKPNIRQLPATNRPATVMDNPISYYESLNRNRIKQAQKAGTKPIIDSNNQSDRNSTYYSLPRRSKIQSTQNGTVKISSSKHLNSLPTIDGSLKRSKKIPPPLKIAPDINNISNNSTMNNSNTDNSINFNSTLAKAGTHSPPIKRRSSSLLAHSPSIHMPSRFASRSTINDIYTQKNQKEYLENDGKINQVNLSKYRKVAAEILKENLERSLGQNPDLYKSSRHSTVKKDTKETDEKKKILSPNHSVETVSSATDSESDSSSESSDSTSFATDEQVSISSIPQDDIPLGYQSTTITTTATTPITVTTLNTGKINSENLQNNQLNITNSSLIQQDTVSTDIGTAIHKVDEIHLSMDDDDDDDDDDDSVENKTKEIINEKTKTEIKNEKVSDDEDEDEDDEEEVESADEYDLDNDLSSSNGSLNSGDENLEDLKKMFIPLYEIERMGDDFAYHQMDSNNNNTGLIMPDILPEHQHSQSFRIENTSQASQIEVFVHKESLQKAKDCLQTNPSHGILSKRLTGKSEPIEGAPRTKFDPHILLLDACLEPDYELVRNLIPRVKNISKSTIDGITALHNAVCSGDAKLVLHLLQCGAYVNASDADGWTPLHCSACCNNKQISSLLVEHGASLFAQTLSDYEIPSQKCNKSNHEDSLCEEYLFYEQENIGVKNNGVVYALFNYEPANEDELALYPNQILRIINTNPPDESGWFLAEDISDMDSNTAKRGFIAAAYVSCYQLILPQSPPSSRSEP